MPTIGELYDPAMKIRTEVNAKKYLEYLVVRHMTEFKVTREEATRNELENIGYYAGYYSEETRKRVYKLFHCNHPILGDI